MKKLEVGTKVIVRFPSEEPFDGVVVGHDARVGHGVYALVQSEERPCSPAEKGWYCLPKELEVIS